MYSVGVTLRSSKYLRYAAEIEICTVCSRHAHSQQKLILMFTLDILYIHHTFPFAMRTANAAARKKKVVHTQLKYRDSPPRRKGVNATVI